MGFDIATQTAGKALGPVGGAALNAGMGIVNNVGQLIFGRALQKQQLKGQKEALANQNAAQYDMWLKTNYSAQKEQMEKAGLNPGLLYGMSGGGATTTGGASAMPSSGQAHGIMDMQSIAQMRLLEAQAAKLEAETAEIKGDTYQPGEKSANLNADTTNKALQGIVTKYAGQEAGRQWMMNKELSTEEYGAKSDEYAARQSVATNIVRMYEDGTMKKMSDAELQNKLAEIGLKNVNITGREIENALNDMELKLMNELGMGRNAKGWAEMGIKLLTFILGKK